MWPAVCHHAGNAIKILRKRAALGTISGAEENVDLGALLDSLVTSQLTLTPGAQSLATLLDPASTVYKEAIKSFRRDAELPDVSTAS